MLIYTIESSMHREAEREAGECEYNDACVM